MNHYNWLESDPSPFPLHGGGGGGSILLCNSDLTWAGETVIQG